MILTPEQKAYVVESVQNSGLPVKDLLDAIGVSASYWRWRKLYNTGGLKALRNKRPGPPVSKCTNETLKAAIFKLLHAPPMSYNINRTTWRQADLKKVLKSEKNIIISKDLIGHIIKDAGYKYRKAKIVLTSNDPEYREKLNNIKNIKNILSNLSPEERFFSIDEYGPFSVRARPGRRLVPANEYPTVPQYQKSKGYLIMTAALELSTNQITHFYSKRKDTTEMLKLMDILLKQYRSCEKFYLSWDAASWQASKRFIAQVKEINTPQYREEHKTPAVALAPLPARAQFLNVIESVFSGLAKAIIHNSDYDSIESCKSAIDRYFTERNEHFRKNPKRAGKKIWGEEKVPPVFSEVQNCKNSQWR